MLQASMSIANANSAIMIKTKHSAISWGNWEYHTRAAFTSGHIKSLDVPPGPFGFGISLCRSSFSMPLRFSKSMKHLTFASFVSASFNWLIPFVAN